VIWDAQKKTCVVNAIVGGKPQTAATASSAGQSGLDFDAWQRPATHTRGIVVRITDRVRWEQRLAQKLRIAEDCLQRALDQLEEASSNVAWTYVKEQVDKAHDAVIDAQGAARVLCPEAGIV